VKGYPASFASLFDATGQNGPRIKRVEIPLIQRDYAQGRLDRGVTEIRDTFLDVLHAALTGGEDVGLDFVYGEVDDGTLRPLDGQQRLTTLFLLHWYLAARTGRLDGEHAWKNFSYATRQSARLFCERLVNGAPDAGTRPSEWITDQPWFLYTWTNDPTINSMLTVIDAVNERFAEADLEAAWVRLTDAVSPAISFHLLPIEDMGSGETLYIKMNSRGKPLTPFETFKARFEKALTETDRDQADHVARKIDGAWSDLLWPIHGGDNLIDDEFLRYLGFVVEVCEWREGRLEQGPLGPRTEQLFAANNDRAQQHLDFLCACFDVWGDAANADATFRALFATTDASGRDEREPGQVVRFGENVRRNLFEACCRTFGDMAGANRVFGLADSLLLYAVLVHLIERTADLPRRLRIVNNLLAASTDEVRRQNMPKLLDEVRRIIVDGTIDGIDTFNQAQVDDERLKLEIRAQHPHLAEPLDRLEDHPILRGSLQAFALEPEKFASRAAAFDTVFSDPDNWPAATRALLACGEYQRRLRSQGASFQFGSMAKDQEGAWRRLLTGARREGLAGTAEVLGALLDRIAASNEPAPTCLAAVAETWLRGQAEAGTLDWRYYLVRYDAMRDGESGIYYSNDPTPGYSLIMLRRRRLNSYYRDPYLYAVWHESGVGEAVDDPWFYGYEPAYGDATRALRLARSGSQLRLTDRAIIVRLQSATGLTASLLQRDGVVQDDGELVVALGQAEDDGRSIDTEDRIAKAAAILREMVAAGL
jgi:hypothetical protein